MINLPNTVEPPDMVLVEVLEALPDRPISGERLVRPDGKISLGFYGDVDARGLTVEQLKVAIIKHLRNDLYDIALGLVEEPAPAPGSEFEPVMPRPPEKGQKSLDRDAPGKVRPSSRRSRPASYFRQGPRARRQAVGTSVSARQVSAPAPRERHQEPEDLKEASKVLERERGRRGRHAVIDKQVHTPQDTPEDPRGIRATVELGGAGSWVVIPPAESRTVFVDVTAYNSKHYYVEGDVQSTGKMPCTGSETVLDALQYSGGLVATAEPNDIRLVRPGRNGMPARIYKVDLHAILEKGDVTSNYQLFPNDRLIIGRNEVVKRTVELDRLSAPIQTVNGSMLQYAFMLRALQFATAGDREELLRELVDFWTKGLSQKGDLKFDEQTLRESLLRRMKLPPAPVPAPDMKVSTTPVPAPANR
jgi:protein involved in polysaccharide export with SLBB domain